MAKKSKAASSAPKVVAKIRTDLLAKRIEALEGDFDLTANTLIARKRMSTGLLALDMQWGGGMVPGMYTIAGIERSGKSTIITQIFGEMMRNKVAFCNMRDAEGTVGVDIDYTRALLGNDLEIDLSELIYGKRATKADKRDLATMTKPRIHVEPNIEETYEFFRAVLDLLPDKIYSKDDKCWMFKAPDNDKGKAQMELLGDIELEKRKKGSKNFLYAPTDDGMIGFIAIDSYPALLPTAVDEAGERSKRMGQEAAAFANSLPLIVEKLVKKGFAILGANQLRENPSDQYNPWREPGGNALKQFSQVRDWIHAVGPGSIKTTPALWEKGEYPLNSLCMEDSVEDPSPSELDTLKELEANRSSKDGKLTAAEKKREEKIAGGGKDYYQFSYLSNKKNKTAVPLTRAEIRIWTRDRSNKGRGIDPVFDTWFYLTEMGMATVHAKRITCKKFFGDKKPHWLDFKAIILAEVSGDKERFEKAWAAIKCKPVKIREWCFADLRKRTNADPDKAEMDMLEKVKETEAKAKPQKKTKPVKDKGDATSYEADPKKPRKKKKAKKKK